MISVSTDSYFAMVRAAQLQAVRTGVPLNEKQSIPIAVDEQAPPPAPPEAASTVRQIVDVLV
ncbi:hypothetical protein MKK75_31375 [Methylobacterium sp. J-030]|uniref:hypothetical protein n=1 Tax=Methylobacterium sp. J-030 TaxID=2836627 RepID=UPI001FBB753B|nr:hypothetical protein [Methylobacterium sp. J-030]MCJ2073235.1 hypothetical protein [Methylobacterium sp. J-030]